MQHENGGMQIFQGGDGDGDSDGFQARHFLVVLVGVACVAVIAVTLYRRRKRRAYHVAVVNNRLQEGVFRDDSDGDGDEMKRNDNDHNGTVEFADTDHTDPNQHLYTNEFTDATATAAPAMEDINLEEPAVGEWEETHDPLQPPVASMPTLAKATSLPEEDDEEDPEDSLPYFT